MGFAKFFPCKISKGITGPRTNQRKENQEDSRVQFFHTGRNQMASSPEKDQ